MFSAYPLFGIGLGILSGLLRYQTYGFDVGWSNAHNDYLEFLAELGIFGFAILAVLIGSVFLRAVRTAVSNSIRDVRYFGLACVGALAMLIHSVADFNMFVPANAIAFSWILGLAAGVPDTSRPVRSSAQLKTPRPSLIRTPVIVMGVLLVLHSTASLVFCWRFKNDPQAERVFCRFGICSTDETLSFLQRQHGGSVAAVPRSYLLDFLRRDPAGRTAGAISVIRFTRLETTIKLDFVSRGPSSLRPGRPT